MGTCHQAKLEEQVANVDSHVEFVHQELAKSIFIIDKHSLEIDELAIKLKDSNGQSTVGKIFHFWRIIICQKLKFHVLKVA